jgi:hypothetical protein
MIPSSKRWEETCAQSREEGKSQGSETESTAPSLKLCISENPFRYRRGFLASVRKNRYETFTLILLKSNKILIFKPLGFNRKMLS